jgi:hypothetical protein
MFICYLANNVHISFDQLVPFVNQFNHLGSVVSRLKVTGGSAPTSELSTATSDVSPSTSQDSPLTINHRPIIPLGSSPLYNYSNLDKNYVGYCIFVCA